MSEEKAQGFVPFLRSTVGAVLGLIVGARGAMPAALGGHADRAILLLSRACVAKNRFPESMPALLRDAGMAPGTRRWDNVINPESSEMPKLFSYVVDHDLGFAPNPYGGFCSLAKCKYGKKRRNIVELAEEGDWIAGTGGANHRKSAGHGKLIYAMCVDEKIPLAAYFKAHKTRCDAKDDVPTKGRFALLSKTFYYFGRDAIDIDDIPKKHLQDRFEKRGPGYRCDFSEEFIEDFVRWLKANFKKGMNGQPCKPFPECASQIRTRSQRKRRKC